ncbi:MAG: hypothetical protein Q7S92_03715 [Candidatus Diapherotrites archaeon]|nr:hypothetical protein [Candidatus Diapherotrites archaeon]
MSFVKNFFLGLIISLFALTFTAFVLIHSAQTSFLDPVFVVSALDSSQVSKEAYASVPQLSSVVSEQEFTQSFKQFISDLIHYIKGSSNVIPTFSLPNTPVNLSLEQVAKPETLQEARSWIVLLNSLLPFLAIIGIVILFILLLLSSSLKDKIETLQKTFWRAGISMLISSALAYVLLTFSGNNLFPNSESLASLSQFLSILLNKFLINSIILALIPTILGIVLFFAKKSIPSPNESN